MAVDDTEDKSAARRIPLGIFNADETVRGWVRLATESRGGQAADVRLQLTIDLRAVVEASGREKAKLFDSLVTLVGTASVEAQLMLVAAKPGSGVTGNRTGPVATPTPAPAPVDNLQKPSVESSSDRSALPPPSVKPRKKSRRK